MSVMHLRYSLAMFAQRLAIVKPNSWVGLPLPRCIALRCTALGKFVGHELLFDLAKRQQATRDEEIVLCNIATGE